MPSEIQPAVEAFRRRYFERTGERLSATNVREALRAAEPLMGGDGGDIQRYVPVNDEDRKTHISTYGYMALMLPEKEAGDGRWVKLEDHETERRVAADLRAELELMTKDRDRCEACLKQLSKAGGDVLEFLTGVERVGPADAMEDFEEARHDLAEVLDGMEERTDGR